MQRLFREGRSERRGTRDEVVVAWSLTGRRESVGACSVVIERDGDDAKGE